MLDNPLAELGITPELARRLNSEQLKAAAEALVKELLRQFHTDTGSTASTDNLTWLLGVRRALAERPIAQLRRDHIDPRRMKEGQQRKLAEAEAVCGQLRMQVWQYMQAVAGLQTDSLLHLGGRTLHLCDVVAANLGMSQPHQIFFELLVSEDGSLTRKQRQRLEPSTRRLLGAVPKARVPEGILSLMPREAIKQELSFRRKMQRPATHHTLIGPRKTVPTKAVAIEDAEVLLRLLVPTIQKDNYLFSIGMKGGVPHLFLEGVVTRL